MVEFNSGRTTCSSDRHASLTASLSLNGTQVRCYDVASMSITAFVVKVPGAEPLVSGLRDRFDATTKLGVPAHITLLIPFMAIDAVTADVVKRAQRALDATPAFSFSLATVGRFPTTAYLGPEPATPFIAMTQALVGAFPDFLPYGGLHQGSVPHLTVAHGDAEEANEAADALQILLRQRGPVVSVCSSISLLENSSGRWRESHVFDLRGAA